ncbi:MAG: glycerate kinase, partial [Candidatus Nanopelagicales bacterium]|nr:glycerate kinase [Candidatus Nanopelagicales bacterium]
VVTGEGCCDWQSLRGKVVTGVATAALAQSKPVVLIAGKVEVGGQELAAIGVTAAYAVTDTHPGGLYREDDPAASLARRSEWVARQWASAPKAEPPTRDG